MSPRNALLEAALHYASAEIGRPVFPCEPGGKRPIVKHGLRAATRNADRIERWWSAHPEANVGMVCGGGVLVLDVDGDDGRRSLARLETEHGALPPSVESVTGRGRHIFFAIDRSMRSTAGRLGPGLDTRGDGSYIVAPPSVHPSGHVYRWRRGHGPESDLAELPTWMADLLQRAGGVVSARNPAQTGPETAPTCLATDLSRSGQDALLALRMVREGATDLEIERALYRDSRKVREEKRGNAGTYVELTIKFARNTHAANTPRVIISKATLQRLPARFGKPELTRLALELVTQEDGEVITGCLIVPSAGYPRAAKAFAAVLPDVSAERLAAPWREAGAYFLTLRLRGRALEVATRGGEVRWLRAVPDAVERRTGT